MNPNSLKSTDIVRSIINNYESDNPNTQYSLRNILMSGNLGGTGKLVILPVDQGFEHGPDRSFSINPDAYDPHYHYQLAIDAGMSAYAAPLGMLESGIESFSVDIPSALSTTTRRVSKIPLILKCNSANSLSKVPNQAITGSVKDAIRLNCSGVGFTIYPGSDNIYEMMEEAREIFEEAKEHGLVCVLWSYPRGSMSKEGETAINVVSYAAHMAALCGAHIIKVKLPTKFLEPDSTKDVFIKNNIPIDTLTDRVKHIIKSAFNGRRIVVFSGGAAKNDDELMEEIKAIKNGGGFGSIIGRNSFQRPKEKALKLLKEIMDIYKK